MKKLIVYILILMFLSSCEVNNKDDTLEKLDFEFLKGTWVDKESFAMQFMDFYSETQARFGIYDKNFEKYDSFNYRFFDDQIAINFLHDNEDRETFHNFIIVDNETIEIGDLTIIPENPNKIYLKRDIITERKYDTIIIGHDQIYNDFENNFQLQMDSVLNDSRCPPGFVCYHTGNARVKFVLTISGNFRYILKLDTYHGLQTDTLIDNIRYKLVGLIPYYQNVYKHQEDYIAKILTEKQ